MRPQLQRLAEFFVDGDGTVDADAAIGGLRGVVEFAQRGVPRARVVAFLRAFQRRRAQPFKHGDAFFGRKLFEQSAQRGTHNACADEGDVRVRDGRSGHHAFLDNCVSGCLIMA